MYGFAWRLTLTQILGLVDNCDSRVERHRHIGKAERSASHDNFIEATSQTVGS